MEYGKGECGLGQDRAPTSRPLPAACRHCPLLLQVQELEEQLKTTFGQFGFPQRVSARGLTDCAGRKAVLQGGARDLARHCRSRGAGVATIIGHYR